MHTLLLHVFKQLEQTQVCYCVIRGYEELETLDDRGDVDLLVAADQMPELRAILAQLQFVRLPSWGHAPHQFYVAYDETTDRWIKLDIVTEVVYGKPIPTLATDLAAGCLARRQGRGETYVPAPEDELVTLLLHCLLDKGAFAPHRLARVQELRHEVRDEALMNRLLRSAWAADMSWARLAALIDSESWSALLAAGPGIARRLKHGQRLAAVRRRVGGMALRKLDRVAGALQPRSLERLFERRDQQLIEFAGQILDDIIVGAALERLHRKSRVHRAGHVDNGRSSAPRPDPVEHVHAGFALQRMVESHDIDAALGDPVERVGAPRHMRHRMAAPLQRPADEGRERFVVLDIEHVDGFVEVGAEWHLSRAPEPA